jgi:hypothetical protein
LANAAIITEPEKNGKAEAVAIDFGRGGDI